MSDASSDANTELYNTYLAAKENVISAPDAVIKAEKAYYVATEGDDGYDKLIRNRNTTQARQLQTQLITAHEADVAQIDASIATYASTASYASNVGGVVLTQLNEIISMSEAVQNTKDITTTNNRKSVFLDMQRTSITKWDAHVTIGVWVLALIYAKQNTYQMEKPLPWVIFISIMASPWILSMLGWVIGRSIPPFNIYTTFSA